MRLLGVLKFEFDSSQTTDQAVTVSNAGCTPTARNSNCQSFKLKPELSLGMEAEIEVLFLWKTHAYPPRLAKLAKQLEDILHIIKNDTKDYMTEQRLLQNLLNQIRLYCLWKKHTQVSALSKKHEVCIQAFINHLFWNSGYTDWFKHYHNLDWEKMNL